MALKLFDEPEGVYAYDISIHNYVFSKLVSEKFESDETNRGMLLRFLKMIIQKSSIRYEEFEKEMADGTLCFEERYPELIIKCDEILTKEEGTKVDVFISGLLKNEKQAFKIEVYVVNGALGFNDERNDKIASYVNDKIETGDSIIRYLVCLKPSGNIVYDNPQGFLVITFDEVKRELRKHIPNNSQYKDFYRDYEDNNLCNFEMKIEFTPPSICNTPELFKNIKRIDDYFRKFRNGEAQHIIANDIVIWKDTIKVWDRDQLRMVLESEGARKALEKKVGDSIRLNIDVSEVGDMMALFMGIDGDEILDLSDWNVSNVENMCMMFYNTHISFTGLKNWDVSKVRNMKWMLADTEDNRDIVDCWKKKGLLNNEIEDIFYKADNTK